MSGVSLTSKGSFRKTIRFLDNIVDMDKWIGWQLDHYGKLGVKRLREATPVDSGKTADGWYFERSVGKESCSISWWNTNVNDGVPIALVIEYGHITGWGGYVPPYPYIGDALLPVITDLQKKIWEVVTDAK